MISWLICAAALAAQPELVSVKRIWGEAPHSAFGDIIRFQDRWYAVFREGKKHVASPTSHPDDGKLRVITSVDGESWKAAALLEEAGVDLRDPHLSVTPDGRLMIVAGGSIYREGVFKGRRPRVAFSRDGAAWSAPQAVWEEGFWLWRVTWHKGTAYGVAKFGDDDNRYAVLVKSRDGVKWDKDTELRVPGIDETTVRFEANGTMVALGRNEVGNRHVHIGHAKPPYSKWEWADGGHRIGGPNFIVLPDGSMWAGGRRHLEGGARTTVARMNLTSYEPALLLPSGGDNSYPGFVWHQGLLWTLYYSSHEDKTSIYLAKIKVSK